MMPQACLRWMLDFMRKWRWVCPSQAPRKHAPIRSRHKERTPGPRLEPLEQRELLSFIITSTSCEVWANISGPNNIDYHEITTAGTVSASGQNSAGSASATASLSIQATNSTLTAQASSYAQGPGSNTGASGYIGADTFLMSTDNLGFHFSLTQTSLCQVQSTLNDSHPSEGRYFAVNNANTSARLPITSSLSTILIPAGNYVIEFGADGTYAGSDVSWTAATITANLTMTIVGAETTTTALTSSSNPSSFGQPVTFTASVAPTTSGQPVPTGTVNFMDGSTQLGTGTLNASGLATFTSSPSTLTLGNHSITAVYGGDSNFSSSTSSPVTQIVKADDFVLNSVSTTDSNELTVNYNINTNLQAEGVQSLAIDIYRSDKPVYDATDEYNLEVASYQLSGSQLDLNQDSNPSSSIKIQSNNGVWGMNSNILVAPLAPAPYLPYVLAVVDPRHQLPAAVTTDASAAHFRIYTIAAVTQGFGPGEADWVQPMVNAIRVEDNYDSVFPIYWNSFRPSPGQTTLGAQDMFTTLVQNANSLADRLQPNDIIDVQLIGHSRGSAVIDQAMQMLVNVNAGSVLPQLAHGYYKLTFLDPHPANNQSTRPFWLWRFLLTGAVG